MAARRSNNRSLTLVLLVALALRLAAAGALHARLPERFLFPDSGTYWVLAENLARGSPYRYGTDPDQGRILRMPGYPLFLAAMLRPAKSLWPVERHDFLGSMPRSHMHLLMVRLLQTLLGVLAVYLVYCLGRNIWDARVGLVAASLSGVYPVFVGFTPLVLSETLFAVLLLGQLLACVALWRAIQQRSIGAGVALALLVGVLWGLATLVRGSWIASAVLVLAPYLFAKTYAHGPNAAHAAGVTGAKRCGMLAVVFAAFAATMGPWWIRNAAVTGRFVPTTLSVGASLYDGMHEGATGASDMRFLDEIKRERLSEYDQDRELRRRALEFARRNPRRVLELGAIKFLRFWNMWPNAPEFRSWPLRLIVLVSYVPVLLLGLIGLWRHRRRGWPVLLLAAPLAYLCLVHVVFVGSLRYRLPGMYPWTVLAGAAVAAGRRDRHCNQRRTRDVYGLLWTRYGPIRTQQDEATFYAKTEFSQEDLRGRLVLDAGCGNGRYLRVAAAAGARAVGLDLSAAVFRAREVALEYVGHDGPPRVELIQGDLLRPPLADESFDAVFAIGVLEHTPDAQRAFQNLIRLLRPGGILAVWLHPKWRPALERIDRIQRAVSSRLPPRWLAVLSRALVPLGGLKRRLLAGGKPARFAGRVLHALTLGVSLHPDPATRCCDTFNWYAPQWRSHHTPEEVRGWFQRAGLVEIRDLGRQAEHFHEGQGAGVCFSGRRPT